MVLYTLQSIKKIEMLKYFLLFISLIISNYECLHCHKQNLQLIETDTCCSIESREHRICNNCFKKKTKKEIEITSCLYPGCKKSVFFERFWYSRSFLDCMDIEDISLSQLRSHIPPGLSLMKLTDEDYSNPLIRLCYNTHFADIKQKKNLITFLIKNLKFNIDSYNMWGDTPLSISVANKEEEIVDHLLEEGANPNLEIISSPRCPFGINTPLSEAISNNDIKTIKKLLRHKARPKISDLEWACIKKSINIAKLMIQKDPGLLLFTDINMKGLFGKTLLMHAVETGDKSLVKKFLNNSYVNPLARDDENKTTLELSPTRAIKNLIQRKTVPERILLVPYNH